MYQAYFATIRELLDGLEQGQGPAIVQAATAVADVIAAGGVVHVFGSGHSHMMAEEVFHRAGGLMAVNAILDPNLTSFGLLKPGTVERTEGYAGVILSSYDLRPGELLLIVSNSGINPLPVELAMAARAQGVRVIAITSAMSYATVASRHSSGKKLVDVADMVVDSCVPMGDATLDLDADGIRVGPVSTVLGAALMNAIMAEAAAILLERGVRPPAVVSMNVPGGDEMNRQVMEQYRQRLRVLKD
jgi:uncharacterized phosphosugar-binding protein